MTRHVSRLGARAMLALVTRSSNMPVTRLLRLRRTLAATAVAPLLVTGLVACGGDDEPTSASSSASSESGSSPSSDGASSSELQPGDSVEPGDLVDRMTAGFDAITTAHTTMKLTGSMTGTLSGEGDVDYTGDSPAVSMTLQAPSLGGEMKTLLVDGVMYLNLDQITHGKYWKVDLSSPDSPLGALGDQLDPKSSLATLQKGMDSVTYVGQEDVDGQPLDHYRASVDSKALLDQMGPDASAGAGALPKTLTYDIWLDDQDRVTRLTSDLGSAGKLEMTLSDWGKDVSIEAPPADQVTEGPSIAG